MNVLLAQSSLSSDILQLVAQPVQSLVEPITIGSTGGLGIMRSSSSSLDFITINSGSEGCWWSGMAVTEMFQIFHDELRT